MAATLLADSACVLHNVPALEDIKTMVEMLRALNARVEVRGKNLVIDASGELGVEAPYDIVRKMRASYYVLGPLLGRLKKAKVALPGGCAIGPRPIDLHLKGMRKLGAKVRVEHGYVRSEAKALIGNEMVLEGVKGASVGATCNVMMAAVLASGRTVIKGAACEPEVVDLASFLLKMGAEIKGAGTPTITIEGVNRLSGADWTPIPDRIETGTFAVASVITRGDVEITNCIPDHIFAVLEILKEVGAEVATGSNYIRVRAAGPPKSVSITTAPYPGFPTDMQAQFMALLSLAPGTSTITETIFEARFLHALELARLGADITLDGSTAIIRGVEKLTGAQVMASDLRASAALVLAGLAAEGETQISRIYHLDRGYESLEQKLSGLGAEVRREQEQ
jgi:UDP-N-acetylglucosamine 1-carboxyvinyltransferase